MKITIYTINDCTFSQAEKDFLKKNTISFEEKNLETNRDFLTEMLKISDNFAGTPVTKVEKDGGEILVLKGFTESEFAKALDLPLAGASTADSGSTTPTPPMSQTPSAPPIQTKDQQINSTPDMTIESLSEPAVSTQTPSTQSQPVMPPTPQTPADTSPQKTAEPPVNPLETQEVGPISLDANTTTPTQTPQQIEEKPKHNEALNSVLQNLQTQVQSGAVSPTGAPKS